MEFSRFSQLQCHANLHQGVPHEQRKVDPRGRSRARRGRRHGAHPGTALPAAAATRGRSALFVSVLRGANEVPSGGPRRHRDRHAPEIDPTKDEVCYFLAQSKLDTVILAHIHKGAAGVNGPVVVPLTAPVDGTS